MWAAVFLLRVCDPVKYRILLKVLLVVSGNKTGSIPFRKLRSLSGCGFRFYIWACVFTSDFHLLPASDPNWKLVRLFIGSVLFCQWEELWKTSQRFEDDLVVCVGFKHGAAIRASIVRATSVCETKLTNLTRYECRVRCYVSPYSPAHALRLSSEIRQNRVVAGKDSSSSILWPTGLHTLNVAAIIGWTVNRGRLPSLLRHT